MTTDKATEYYEKGMVFFDREEYLNAILAFTRALQTGGDIPSEEVYLYRAYAWFKRGEYEIAVSDINDALRQSPDNPSLYNARGRMRRESAQYGKAIRDFTLALEIDPHNPSHYYERSIAHSSESNWSAALEDIDKAIRLAGRDVVSTHPKFFIQRAVIRMNMGEHEKGLEDCHVVQRLDRPSAEAFRVCGDIYLAMGDHTNAGAMFYKATEIDPGLKELDISLARNHHQRREFDKAILYCNRYVDSFPNAFEAYQIRADSRYYLGEADEAILEEARKDCDRAIEYNPHYLEAYRTLLKIFQKQGDYMSHKYVEEKIREIEQIKTRNQITEKGNRE